MYAAVSGSSNGVDFAPECHALLELTERRIVEPRRQLWLTGQHERQELLGRGLDVREQPRLFQQLGAETLRFVDDEGRDLAALPVVSRSTCSSSASNTVLDWAAPGLSSKRRASISTNSDRVSAGLFRYTHRTSRQRSDSRAARKSVVLPVPASPINTVTALAENSPYCRLLSASRCRGVMNRYFGFGVSSNGSSRRP